MKIAADVRKLETKNDVHTTKTHRRERGGADDIHHESYAIGHHNEDNMPQCYYTKRKNTQS
jgi:hypothetical protein